MARLGRSDVVVVGVDGCRGGWVGVVLGAGEPRGVFAASLTELVADVPGVAGVGIDMPIGLEQGRRRGADLVVRRELGPRRSSVFLSPVRAAVEADTYAEANAANRAHAGFGLSRQAWNLVPRIREVEAFALATDVPCWEVHPELSFTALRGGTPATAPKSTWHGIEERRAALAAAGIDLRGVGDAGRHAGVDDVLDAAAVAWSTARIVRGEGRCLPADPPADPVTGWPMAIWV